MDLGDEKDCVLIWDNGLYIYFVVDVVYYLNKLDCGFENLIDVWGVDYYGYIVWVCVVIEVLIGKGDLFYVVLI